MPGGDGGEREDDELEARDRTPNAPGREEICASRFLSMGVVSSRCERRNLRARLLLPLAGEGGLAKRGRMRVHDDDRNECKSPQRALIRPRCAGPPSPAKREKEARVDDCWIMFERSEASPLHLPGRRAVLIVLQRDAHRRELVADAVGLGPVLCGAGGEAGRDQADVNSVSTSDRLPRIAAVAPSRPSTPARTSRLDRRSFRSRRRARRRSQLMQAKSSAKCVFRSSASALRTSPDAAGVGSTPQQICALHLRRLASASSSAFTVKSIGWR